jgi:thiamine transporter ThiT
MLGKANIHKLTVSAMMLALALVLPFLTGQIPQVGKMLCPMHFPILLCGFFCGPWLGAGVGFCAPLLRSFIFGVPHLMPDAVAMCFELAVYGAVAGLLYLRLPRRRVFVYVSLLAAMLAGRIVWGGARVVLYGIGQSEFGWAAFMAGAFTKAIPGIIAQILLIPILVIALEKVLPDSLKNRNDY